MNYHQYNECYVAYLDILGMKTLIAKSKQEPELRTRLWNALQIIKHIPPYLEGQKTLSTETAENVLRIHVLSDSVILFIPAQTSVAWFLWVIRRLYDQLICLGLCFRGAVTVGGMVWEEQDITNYSEGLMDTAHSSVALGPALVEAVLLESEVAIYPRIILTECLCAHIRGIDLKNQNSESHLAHSIFPLASRDCQLGVGTFIKSDFDGRSFLDILHKKIRRSDKIAGDGTRNDPNRFDDTPRETWIQRYRNVAAEGLGSARDEKIKAKYAWLLNYVCQACKGQCSDHVQDEELRRPGYEIISDR